MIQTGLLSEVVAALLVLIAVALGLGVFIWIDRDSALRIIGTVLRISIAILTAVFALLVGALQGLFRARRGGIVPLLVIQGGDVRNHRHRVHPVTGVLLREGRPYLRSHEPI